MKTTSDMQQSFYEREIKETKLLPFDIHTHTHTCRHQMVYS